MNIKGEKAFKFRKKTAEMYLCGKIETKLKCYNYFRV